MSATQAPPRTPHDAETVGGSDSASTPPERGQQKASSAGDGLRAVVLVLLLAAATLPIARGFTGLEIFGAIAGALLVAVGLAWGARQLGAGSFGCALASAVGWIGFTTGALAPSTAVGTVVPTSETVSVVRELFVAGWTHLAESSAPTTPEPGLVLLIVTGVWVITTIAHDSLVVRAQPLLALAAALVLLSVPLALVPTPEASGVLAYEAAWAVPFLAAAVVALLVTGRSDLRRWGRRADAAAGGRGGSVATGLVVGAVAIAVAIPAAQSLPGYDEEALYRLSGGAGTSVATNPMVTLRPNLTAQDTGTVLEVTSPRPVYLRTTALDVYDRDEQWTAADGRITGSPIENGEVPPEIEVATGEDVDVEVEITDMTGVLVPAPYQPREVSGPLAEQFQFDSRTGTMTLAEGEEYGPGDRFEVVATVPSPDPELVASAEGFDPDGDLTALPRNVPESVQTLADDIVAEADAGTPFEKALAIQNELRTWQYSLDPPQGHGPDALQAFLDTRTGYCEQFASTMAVMLRTLDVPARVAVGFSPGTLADAGADRWEVTNANAHAWVEVLFPGAGWISFEPTPRSDGNVLVPSGADLAPGDTQAADHERAHEDELDETAPDLEDTDVDQPDTPAPDDPDAGAARDDGDSADGANGWGGVLAVVVVSTGAGLVWARRRRRGGASPVSRALSARERVERLGRGVGVHPRPSETDQEYLERLGHAQAMPSGAVTQLATQTAKVRYAPELSEQAAAAVERAAGTLEQSLAPSPLRRRWLLARGSAARWAGVLRRRG